MKGIDKMNTTLLIESLEYYYETEIFAEYDRNKGGIEHSFDMLRKSIEIQQTIIELKKSINLDITDNENTLTKLKNYWKEDINDLEKITGPKPF